VFKNERKLKGEQTEKRLQKEQCRIIERVKTFKKA
jgi:hypothetical protein